MKTWTLALLTLCVVAVTAHRKIRQKRSWIVDSFTIEEEHPGPFPYALGVIHIEKKYLVHFKLHGSGVEKDPKGVLSINTKTGEIFVHKKIDYEAYPILKLTFEAKNVSNNEVDTRLGLEVKVKDVNDHPPVFEPLHYETAINESLPQGKLVTTVFAADKDDSSTNNGTFKFRLLSTTPKTENVEFYIIQNIDSGSIYFKGCLDYEKAQKYTLIIEAKDDGDKVQFSSTSKVTLHIIDNNNHIPEITGHSGRGKIKEGESGVEVLRLQVMDNDAHGTPAWRAKFTIHDDKEKYFQIKTDPKTNEGIVTIIKAMDYEQQRSRNLSISVKNEIPYFICKIKEKTQELWDVENFVEGYRTLEKLYPVSIAVEDINDPPEFVPRVKEVTIMENTKIGTPLCNFTAQDRDTAFGHLFHFEKHEDAEDWVTIDRNTGEVFVAKTLDRESPFVKNDAYHVILHVVDNAQPPLTGTGTLIIHLGDMNDNIPLLETDKMNMCLSDKETMASIIATDLDLPPYTGPFHYELQGDVKGRWRFEPNYGTTVNLIKEKHVHSGHYELQAKITDNQGYGIIHNLSITVCDCTVTANCHVRTSMSAQPSHKAIGIIFLAFLLLLAFLLMALLVSCKEKKTMIPTDEAPDWYLVSSNTETPGTDVLIPRKIPGKTSQIETSVVKNTQGTQNGFATKEPLQHNGLHQDFALSTEQQFMRRSLRRSSSRRFYQHVTDTMNRNYANYLSDDRRIRQALLTQLNQRLLRLQAPQKELGDYEPHCYTDEGELDPTQNLDTISIAGNEFDPDTLTSSDFQFNTLAAMCMPHLISQSDKKQKN